METHYVDVTYSNVELADAAGPDTLLDMLAEAVGALGARAAIEEVLS